MVHILWDGHIEVLENICASQVLLLAEATIGSTVEVQLNKSAPIRTMPQENSALLVSFAMFLSDIAARAPWLYNETNPPNWKKIAKKYAVDRLEEVNSDIGRRLVESTKCLGLSFISVNLTSDGPDLLVMRSAISWRFLTSNISINIQPPTQVPVWTKHYISDGQNPHNSKHPKHWCLPFPLWRIIRENIPINEKRFQ